MALTQDALTYAIAGKASASGQVRSGHAVNTSMYARRPLSLRPTVLTESVRSLWLGMKTPWEFLVS